MRPSFILLHVAIQCPLTSFIDKTILSPLYILGIFVKINWPYMHRFISELFVLFHWSICLFLWQYHTVSITKALQYCLKSECTMPLPLFFFLKIALVSGDLLCFQKTFQTILGLFFYFWEKCLWNFDKDCIESVAHFVKYGHFNNIDSSNPWTQNIFPFIYVFFNFFYQCFIIFNVHNAL